MDGWVDGHVNDGGIAVVWRGANMTGMNELFYLVKGEMTTAACLCLGLCLSPSPPLSLGAATRGGAGGRADGNENRK